MQSASGWTQEAEIKSVTPNRWSEASVDFVSDKQGLTADEIRFAVDQNAELLVDDLLLYEPKRQSVARSR